MANINSFLDKVNKSLASAPLFFIVPETERGLGLEELLTSYHIVTPEPDYYAKQNSKGNIHIISGQDGGSVSLLRAAAFKELMEEHKTLAIQFFKHTSDGEFANFTSATSKDVRLINNPAAINRQIENKIKQYGLLQENGLSEFLPSGKITNLADLDLESCRREYSEFVVQFPFEHTGESTLIFTHARRAQSEEILSSLKKNKPQLMCKVVKFVSGHPLTINACIYKGQTFTAGLSYQYTGIEGLTTLPSATVGNDWSLVADLMTEAQRRQIVSLTTAVGKILISNYNYRGLFGIDLVWDREANTPKLIEINARQTLSVPMHTKLQLKQGQVPLSLLHLAEFLDIDEEVSGEAYNEAALQPIEAAQVFLRSIRSNPFTISSNYLKSGVYRLVSDNTGREKLAAGKKDEVIFLDNSDDRPLVWQKDFYSILDFSQEGLGLTVKPAGKEIKLNSEMARLQAHQRLGQTISDEVVLLPLAKDTLMSVKHIIEP